jgi:hypothetical protein
MHEHDTGILIRQVPALSCVKGKLEEGDVLLKINNVQVFNDGTVHVEPMKRIDYKYLINNSKIGDEVVFEILREGKKRTEKATLTSSFGTTHIIAPLAFGKQPTYYIIGGGIVVQPVSKNFVYDNHRSFTNKAKEKESDQLVAINCILKSEYTQGYDGFNGELIAKVNNKEINNMHELIVAVQNNAGKLLKIETQSGKIIVLPKLPKNLRDELLHTYQITSDRSPDLAGQHVEVDFQATALTLAPRVKPILFSDTTAATTQKQRNTAANVHVYKPRKAKQQGRIGYQ